MKDGINEVTSAIRALGKLDCETAAQILSTLTAQMNQSGFAAIDIETMDELTGFICGEQA